MNEDSDTAKGACQSAMKQLGEVQVFYSGFRMELQGDLFRRRFVSPGLQEWFDS